MFFIDSSYRRGNTYNNGSKDTPVLAHPHCDDYNDTCVVAPTLRNARNEDTPVLAQQLQGSKCNDKSVVAPIVRRIEETAQGILDARTLYPDCSLADLYNETTMVPELRKAHQANDRAVMDVYGFPVKNFTESDCVARLMKMYKELTK